MVYFFPRNIRIFTRGSLFLSFDCPLEDPTKYVIYAVFLEHELD